MEGRTTNPNSIASELNCPQCQHPALEKTLHCQKCGKYLGYLWVEVKNNDQEQFTPEMNDNNIPASRNTTHFSGNHLIWETCHLTQVSTGRVKYRYGKSISDDHTYGQQITMTDHYWRWEARASTGQLLKVSSEFIEGLYAGHNEMDRIVYELITEGWEVAFTNQTQWGIHSMTLRRKKV